MDISLERIVGRLQRPSAVMCVKNGHLNRQMNTIELLKTFPVPDLVITITVEIRMENRKGRGVMLLSHTAPDGITVLAVSNSEFLISLQERMAYLCDYMFCIKL